MLLFGILLCLATSQVFAQAKFVYAPGWMVDACQNTTFSLDTVLTVYGGIQGNANSWSIVKNPTGGTLSNLPYTGVVGTSSYLNPANISYTPNVGYTGQDTFTVKYKEGIDSSVMTVYINVLATASTSFTYGAGPFCNKAGSSSSVYPNVTGVKGGTFASTSSGLDINNVTGIFSTGQSIPGSYTVNYTYGACKAVVSTNVVINAAPTATISYGASDFCRSFSNISVTVTGQTGGTYTSGTGLVLNAATGTINTMTSTPGQYRVLYTFANAAGCSDTASTIIRILAAPAATISYPGSPFCNVMGTVAVNQVGQTGGIYSAPAGLSLDAISGAIKPQLSTAGTYKVLYTFFNVAGCTDTTSAYVTIASKPAGTYPSLSGPYSLCSGSDATFTPNYVSGGIFSSSNSSIASVNSTTGVVYGGNPGNAIISYTVTDGTCTYKLDTAIVVKALPVISGASSTKTVCVGGTATFSHTPTTNGYWSLYSATVANIYPNGVFSGKEAGIAQISYTVTNGDGCSAIIFDTLKVVDVPVATINYASSSFPASGTASVIQTGTTGGVYSVRVGLAIDASTGTINLSASTPGVYHVVYSFGNGICGDTTGATVTITASDKPVISYGGTSFCKNAGLLTVTQTGVTGGSYSAAYGLNIDTASGQINTNQSTAGTYHVVYRYGTGDTTSADVIILAGPYVAADGYTHSICAGSTTQITHITTGGVWSVKDSSIAMVSNSGLVTGKSAGTTYVYYTVSDGTCSNRVADTIYVTVQPQLEAILGQTVMCIGSTMNLYNTTAGGTWSSSNNAIALINSLDGLVTGVTAGSVTISYTKSNGTCTATVTKNIMVMPAPTASIKYTDSVFCQSGTATATLTGTTGGYYAAGSGLSLDSATGTINLAASAAGAYVVTYVVYNGSCLATASAKVTIKALSTATISYGDSVCTTYSFFAVTRTGTAGGSYSSTAGLVIDSVSGYIYPVQSSIGSYTVTYRFGSGTCANTAFAQVYIGEQKYGTITGSSQVVLGSTSSYNESMPGGTWGNNVSSTGSIDATTGVYTPKAVGNDTLKYIYKSIGCTTVDSKAIQVVAAATSQPITGANTVCVGKTIQLSHAVPGGTWSTKGSIITISNTGLVTGVTAGADSAVYTYISGGSAFVVTKRITVNTAPKAVIQYTGSPYCIGSGTVAVTQTGTTGGTYLGTTGLVINATTGAVDLLTSKAGTYAVRYITSNANGCTDTATASIVVKALPAVSIHYTGSPYCPTGTTTVTQTGLTGGIYNAASGLSLNATTGAINLAASTGGTYVVNYTASDDYCINTTSDTITIVSLPTLTGISGNNAACVGNTSALTNAVTGGVWASSNSAVAKVDSVGVVTAVAPGNATISYTVTKGSCSVKRDTLFYVNAYPYVDTIKGNTNICVNNSTVLSSNTVGGIWSSDNVAVAKVSSAGVVTGVTAGTATISYTYSNGTCTSATTRKITVNATPVATISYAGPYCTSGTATVTQTGLTGGVYSAAAGLVINATTGVINLANSTVGTYTIKYTFGNGSCSDSTTTVVTINPQPVATISYVGSPYCASGTASVYQTGTAGGTYASTTGLVINTTTGVVNLSNSTPGTYTVTYTYGSGACVSTATAKISVNAIPAVPAITAVGPLSFCAGGKVTLASSSAIYNQWMKNGVAIKGDTAATLTVTESGAYTVTVNNGGCAVVSSQKQVTVNPLPTAIIQAGGSLAICEGDNVVFTSGATIGNQWLNNGVAIAGATSNTYAASKAGAYSLVVTTTSGCVDTSDAQAVTVNALPVISITSANGQTLNKGGSTQLTVTSDGAIAAVSWTPAASLDFPLSATPTATPMENTVYTATVTNSAGCETSDTISITVTETFSVTARTIVTPNGDGVNDKFVIDNVTSYPDNVLSIFDRNGKKVYEKHNYDNSWEGTSGGVSLATDTYMYVFTVQGRVAKKGSISIVR